MTIQQKRRDFWISCGIYLALLSYIINSLASTVATPDLWGYLAFGRLYWNSPHFPYHDVFSYVPTLDPWIYHEWLTGVLFYPLYQTLGDAGLQSLKFFLGLATFGLIYLTAWRRGAHPLAIVIVLVMIVPGVKASYSPVRAQVFTFFFFALFLYLLESARLTQRWRSLWPVLLIQVVWCNLHGGFVAGLGLIAIYAVGEGSCRRPFLPYLIILFLAALATLLNPYGLSYWTYLVRAILFPRPEISEWISLFQDFILGLYGVTRYLVPLIILSLILMWRSQWREVTPSLSLVITLFLGVLHIRHLTFLLLLLGAYLPVSLRYYQEDISQRPRLMQAMTRPGLRAAILLGLLLFIFFQGFQFVRKFPFSLQTPANPDPRTGSLMYYPIGAVDFISRHDLSGKMLINFNWGEYFIWLFYPQCQVAIDGRYETVYPGEVVRGYLDFMNAQKDWKSFLNKFPPDMILVETGSRVSQLLAADPAWRKVYVDPGCILFCRNDDLLKRQ